MILIRFFKRVRRLIKQEYAILKTKKEVHKALKDAIKDSPDIINSEENDGSENTKRIMRIINIVHDPHIEKKDSISEFDYATIISHKQLLPFGENIIGIINAIEDMSFEFIDIGEDSQSIYCAISRQNSNGKLQVYAIYKVTYNQEQFDLVSGLVNKDSIYQALTLENYVYRHACGIIFKVVKHAMKDLPPINEDEVYIIREWPDRSEASLARDWYSCIDNYEEEEG